MRALAALALTLVGLIAAPAAYANPPSSELASPPVPDVERPGYLETITDPTWGTEISRISSRRAFEDASRAQRHAYSRVQPWNADGSLLLLGFNYPAPLLDGETYEFLRMVRQPSEALWSNTDPTVMYGESRNAFVSEDVLTDETTVLRRFPRYKGVAIGYGEGSLSNDDRYAALVGERGDGTRDLLVFDLIADVVVARRSIGRHSIDNVTMSQSGDWVVANWNRNGRDRHEGVEVFTRELTDRRQLMRTGEHADTGLTAEGEDVWVSVDYSRNGSLVAYPLAGGDPIQIVGRDGIAGGHVSCRNLERPGWCVFSDTGSRRGDQLGLDQTFAFPIETRPEVEVFAHMHHVPRSGYPGEPHAVPSRDGSRVLFASTWDQPGPIVLAYVAR